MTFETKQHIVYSDCLNPIRSGGALKAPLRFFALTFNFGAILLCVGDFSQKIV